MIGIVNTNFGNINAIRNIYFEQGIECKSVSNHKEINDVDKIIIPGVGHFDSVIQNLKDQQLFNIINELVIKEKMPILGICIGMHIFFESSDEGSLKGFGWLDGVIRKLNSKSIRYPHMGWNNINLIKQNNLFREINNKSYFYFLHSYGNDHDTKASYVSTYTNYGNDIISSIKFNNIYGVQFHPEKSHINGAKLLSNFASIND